MDWLKKLSAGFSISYPPGKSESLKHYDQSAKLTQALIGLETLHLLPTYLRDLPGIVTYCLFIWMLAY